MKSLDDPKIIGIIPARYASVRFPGKMLADIKGKSLIQRTYENAKRVNIFQNLVVATDDKRIFDHVTGFGGQCVMSSTDCRSGTDRLAEVIKTYPEFSDSEIVVNIQGDEPLLNPEIIEKAAQLLIEDLSVQVTTAAVKISNKKEALDRSNVKCVIDLNGNALYFSRALIPEGLNQNWSTESPCFKHLGLYCFRKNFLLQYAKLEPTPLQIMEDLEQLKILENGYKMKVFVGDCDSIGVDTPEDIKKIEAKL